MRSRDPIESLDAFYASCHLAQEPVQVPAGRALKFAVPALGTAIGVVAAIAIASFSAEPSASACESTARVLAKRQLAAEQQSGARQGLNKQPKGRKPWTV